MYLKPLKCTVEAVEEAEFDQVGPRLAPLLHTLCLVWVHSDHYRMPSRIIVILQEICNLLIRQVRGDWGWWENGGPSSGEICFWVAKRTRNLCALKLCLF